MNVPWAFRGFRYNWRLRYQLLIILKFTFKFTSSVTSHVKLIFFKRSNAKQLRAIVQRRTKESKFKKHF